MRTDWQGSADCSFVSCVVLVSESIGRSTNPLQESLFTTHRWVLIVCVTKSRRRQNGLPQLTHSAVPPRLRLVALLGLTFYIGLTGEMYSSLAYNGLEALLFQM